MARVIWARRALNDLGNLIEYIAEDAPAAARRVAQRLFAKVEVLEQQPLLGAFVPEDVSGTYREVRQGKYRIIYRIEGDTVFVLALHHGARLLDTQDLSSDAE